MDNFNFENLTSEEKIYLIKKLLESPVIQVEAKKEIEFKKNENKIEEEQDAYKDAYKEYCKEIKNNNVFEKQELNKLNKQKLIELLITKKKKYEPDKYETLNILDFIKYKQNKRKEKKVIKGPNTRKEELLICRELTKKYNLDKFTNLNGKLSMMEKNKELILSIITNKKDKENFLNYGIMLRVRKGILKEKNK